MSYSHVDAGDLIATARETLLATLLADLPESRRYEALMVANALGVAQRAVQADPRRPIEEGSRLFTLLGGLHPEDGDPRRLLTAAIRRGDFDGGPRKALRTKLLQHLQASVRDRLAIDNPTLLPTAAEGPE